MRFVARFLLRAVALYALLYLLWLPVRPVFTRLVAGTAEALLRWAGDSLLISHLAVTGHLVEFHSPLTSSPGPLAIWNAVDLTVFMLAPLALSLAVPGGRMLSRIKATIPLAALLVIFCIALAVVQIKLAAEIHAVTLLGIRLHSTAELAFLRRANDVMHVVGMLALPSFVFLATYVYTVWGSPVTPEDTRADSSRQSRRSWYVSIGATLACALGIGIVVLLAPAAPGDDPDTLRRAWARVVELNPDFAPAKVNLGLHLEEGGDLAGAIGLFEAATRDDPGLVPAHYNLGNALRRAGRLIDAVGAYERVLQLSPDHAHAHRNLGVALAGLGRSCDAAIHLRESARLDPAFAADPGLNSNLRRLDSTCIPLMP